MVTPTSSVQRTESPTGTPPPGTPGIVRAATQDLSASNRNSTEVAAPHGVPIAPTNTIRRPLQMQVASAAGPRRATALEYYAAEMVRNTNVLVVRTLMSGLAGPAMARLVLTDPAKALQIQIGIAAYSVARRILSQVHTERHAEKATASFNGEAVGGSVLKRRAWEVFNALVLVSHHAPALAATALAINNPAWRPVAAALAFNQIRTEGTSAGRELTRSIGDTVRVGNPSLPEPPYGQTLRPGDVPIGDRVRHAAVAAATTAGELGVNYLVLGGLPPGAAPRGLEFVAGCFAGLFMWIRVSHEDLVHDTSLEKRWTQQDESHVRHINYRWGHTPLRLPTRDNWSPLRPVELKRLMQRVDTRAVTEAPSVIVPIAAEAVRRACTDPAAVASGTVGHLRGGAAGINASIAFGVSGLWLGMFINMIGQGYGMGDRLRAPDHEQDI